MPGLFSKDNTASIDIGSALFPVDHTSSTDIAEDGYKALEENLEQYQKTVEHRGRDQYTIKTVNEYNRKKARYVNIVHNKAVLHESSKAADEILERIDDIKKFKRAQEILAKLEHTPNVPKAVFEELEKLMTHAGLATELRAYINKSAEDEDASRQEDIDKVKNMVAQLNPTQRHREMRESQERDKHAQAQIKTLEESFSKLRERYEVLNDSHNQAKYELSNRSTESADEVTDLRSQIKSLNMEKNHANAMLEIKNDTISRHEVELERLRALEKQYLSSLQEENRSLKQFVAGQSPQLGSPAVVAAQFGTPPLRSIPPTPTLEGYRLPSLSGSTTSVTPVLENLRFESPGDNDTSATPTAALSTTPTVIQADRQQRGLGIFSFGTPQASTASITSGTQSAGNIFGAPTVPSNINPSSLPRPSGPGYDTITRSRLPRPSILLSGSDTPSALAAPSATGLGASPAKHPRNRGDTPNPNAKKSRLDIATRPSLQLSAQDPWVRPGVGGSDRKATVFSQIVKPPNWDESVNQNLIDILTDNATGGNRQWRIIIEDFHAQPLCIMSRIKKGKRTTLTEDQTTPCENCEKTKTPCWGVRTLPNTAPSTRKFVKSKRENPARMDYTPDTNGHYWEAFYRPARGPGGDDDDAAAGGSGGLTGGGSGVTADGSADAAEE